MARLAKRISPDDESDDEVIGYYHNPPRTERSRRQTQLSPSPTASFSSDKENRGDSPDSRRSAKGKENVMGSPQLSSPRSEHHASKRRRLAERGLSGGGGVSQATQSQRALGAQLDQNQDTRYYDPDQPMDERRAVRRGYRDLAKEMTGRRSLTPHSRN
jgi:hypothetical protein